MKKLNFFSAVILTVGLITSSFVQGQSCDTLRNYDPTENFALLVGHDEIPADPVNGIDVDYQVAQYAAYYSSSGPTNVAGVNLVVYDAIDNSGTGSVTFHVYSDNAGEPSATPITSETVNIADLNEMYWNTVMFSTPAAVNGGFFVGFELDYPTPRDTFNTVAHNSTTSSTMFQVSGAGGVLDNEWLSQDIGVFMDVLLTNRTAPVADYTVTSASACVSGEFEVDGSISTGTIDIYNWSISDNPYTQDYVEFDGAVTDVISPTIATAAQQAIYLITYGACTYDIIGYLVDVLPDVDATVTPINTTCGNDNGEISITATGGDGTYTYSIDGGTTTQSNGNFTGLAVGSYDVEVATAGNGCSYTETISITSAPGETITVSADETVCEGTAANLTASGNGTIEWFEGATSIGTGATMSVSPTATTTYDVVLTDANGCTDTDQITVTVTPLADASFAYSSNTICLGGTNETPSVTTAGGTFSVSGAGLVISATNGEIDVSASTAGTYDVTYTISGTCGNSEVQSITITNSPDASFSYSATEFCQNEGAVMPTFPTGASGGTFTSTTGLTIASGTGSVDLASSTPGVYVVTNTIAASGSCAASSETFSITVKETPTVDAGADQAVCEGAEVTLTAASTGGTVTWDNGVTDGTPFTPTTTTTYTVSVDNNGCTATDEVVVTVNPLPTVDAGADQTACTNHSAIALAGTPAGG